MDSERWQRVSRICESAMALTAEGRDAFLDRACADDSKLRLEVEGLLGYEGCDASFLEHGALQLLASTVAGSPAPEEAELPAHSLIGPYRIVRAAGRGGMGEVYQAHDTRLDRAVALKFLRVSAAEEPGALERFQREARAASALNHPHICTVYDIGQHAGRPYLVLEWLQGVSLKRYLMDRTPQPDRTLPDHPMRGDITGVMTAEEIVDVALQVTDACQATHSRGIVHRDIKPGNIFLVERDNSLDDHRAERGGPDRPHKWKVKILDFGLAKFLTESVPERIRGDARSAEAEPTISITIPGRTVGTVAYMSPEQVRGENVDARTDLFSLGVTMYQMAAGSLPFHGETAESAMDAIVHKTPAPPRESNSGVDPRLEQIILKAMSKDPAGRYQNAAELAASLETLVPKPRSSRRSLAAVATVTAVGVGLSVGVRLGWFTGSSPPAPELTPRQATANPAEDPVVRAAISPDGQSLVYTDLAGIHVRQIGTGETRTLVTPPGFCFR